MISRKCVGCHCSGWCEYDFSTDTVYPYQPGMCPETGGQGQMTINEYQKLAMRTAEEKARCVSNVALGLAGESGEVADAVKKYLHQGHPLDREAVLQELGDVAWYVALGATTMGVDLESILQANVDKLLNRYPDGFDPERSMHRAEGDI